MVEKEQKDLQVDKLIEKIQKDSSSAKHAGAALLCHAASKGIVEEVESLLELGVSVNAMDASGRAPLHYAATNTSSDVAELLLSARALPNLEDSGGNSPMRLAQFAERSSTIEVLMDHGALIGCSSYVGLQETLTKEGCLIHREEVDMGNLLSETLKSSVYRATWRGTEVVAKVVKNQTNENEMEELTKELIHEIEVLTSVHHPDLVMFLGAVVTEPYMFITEFMDGGDLERYYMNMRKEKQTPNWHARLIQQVQWCSGVARALCFLHNCKPSIIHRDLKPLNLLLSSSLEIKVADFGISKFTTPTKGLKMKRTHTIGVGSYHYMAPEVVRGGDYDEKADIYSFALIMYFMSSGRDPFWERGKNPEVILQAYGKGEEPRPNLNDAHASVRPIMKDSWAVDPKDRPDARELTKRFHEVPVAQGCGCSLM